MGDGKNMRHKANQFVSLILVLIFAFSVTACSNNNGEEFSNYEEFESESDSSMDASSEYTYDLEELEAEDALDFVNGKAWVTYEPDGIHDKLICINSDGKELISITAEYTPVYASPFYGDTAFIVYAIDNGVYEGSIVDTNGEELYSFSSNTSSDKPAEYVLAYGDGKYVVLRHTSNIDDNFWELGTIDSHGNTIDDFKTFDDLDEDFIPYWGSRHRYSMKETLRRSYSNVFYDMKEEKPIPTYIGEGYFILQNIRSSVLKDYIYNPSDGTLIQADGMINPTFYSEASNGYTLVYTNYLNVIGEHVFDRLNLKTGETEEKVPIKCKDTIKSGGISIVKDGLFFYGHGYFDINGNEKIHIKGFDDKEISCTPYSGGYATLTLEGADGYEYVTVIDSSGVSQFEPKKTDGISLTNDKGYFVSSYNGNSDVYDSNGRIVRHLPLDDSYDYIVSEGFVRATKTGGSSYLFRIPN